MSALKRDKAIEAAEKLVSRGKLEAAVREYRKVLREHPGDTNTLNRLGDLYARLDRTREAVELYQQIAELYAEDGFFVKAIAIYKKIIRQNPTELEVYEQLAELYHRQGLINEARTQYQVVADYYEKHDDTASTTRILEKMAELEPENPSPRVRLAEIFQRQGLLDRAMVEYQKIAEVMLAHGHVEEATKVYLRGLDVDDQDLGFVTKGVFSLKEGGHREAALRFFQAAVERNPQAERVGRLAGLFDGAGAAAGAEEPQILTVGSEGGEGAGDGAAEGEALVLDLDSDEVPDTLVTPPGDVEPVPGEPEPSDTAAATGEDTADLEAEAPAAAAAPSAAVPEVEFEIDLDTLEEDLAVATPNDPGVEEPPAAPRRQGVAGVRPKPFLDTDALIRDLLEETRGLVPTRPPASAAPVGSSGPGGRTEPPPGRAPGTVAGGDLFAAAEALSARGDRRAAMEKLEELLQIQPDHLDALERLILLCVDEGRTEALPPLVDRMVRVATQRSQEGRWTALQPYLERAGVLLQPEASSPEAPAGSPAEGGSDAKLAELESIFADPEAAGEVSAADAAGSSTAAERDFFDLAGELERELQEEGEATAADAFGEGGEESLAEIVESFKRGVAQTLSAEDYDTHFNLGIAYREMGLLDEAIGEFQLAAKDAAYLVDCCSMLGGCFREKGFPELAMKWYRRGLEAPGLTEDQQLGLLYDLGDLHMLSQNRQAAYETFVEVYGLNSNYRDVVAKLEELAEKR